MAKQHPLRAFRVEYDLKLQALADALGISTATLSRIETWQRRCTAEMALRIEGVTKGRVDRHDLRPDLWPI
jgi:DNA-binding transcriptional regulator YdaS (Cro superfamily)